MSIHTGIDPRTLTRIADQVAQLTQPFTLAVKARRQRARAVTHPPLLDQLRAAAEPGAIARGPQRRRMPDSRPAADLGAVDARENIRLAIADWRWRVIPGHQVPAGSDWETSVLRALVGAAPALAGTLVDQLAGDVHHWWWSAAVHAGHNPHDLMRI